MSTLVHYDPFRNFRALQNEINRLFDRDIEENNGMMTQWPVRVDIMEDLQKVVIKADLPSMEQKDIQVNVNNGVLTISGNREFQDENKRQNYYRVECCYGRFSRSFQLPNTIDPNSIQASYKNGELTVIMAKKEEAKPRAIEIVVE